MPTMARAIGYPARQREVLASIMSMPPVGYALIPAVAAVIGALIAITTRPSPAAISLFQHLAAGVVFAAAAGELLPEVMKEPSLTPILIGGCTGILFCYLVKALDSYYAESASFILTVMVDTLIDGLIIGLGFVAGSQQGLLLTAALGLEVLFLGLALTSELALTMSSAAILLLSVAIGAMLPLGTWLGLQAAALPPEVITAGYAFGLMALLYLVTEELLVEAHQVPDTPGTTVWFFIGFLSVVAVEHHLRFAETARLEQPAAPALPPALEQPENP